MQHRLSTDGLRTLLPALLLAASIALAGCGGGGGDDNGNNTNDNSILGKVVDTSGFGVPGASVLVFVSSGNAPVGPQATTLTDGGYRITSLFPGVYTVSAGTMIGGVNYTGSTQAVVTSHSIISNAIIELAPTNQQGIIQGTIMDGNGRGIPGVRVLATVHVQPAQGTTGTSDLLAVTDQNGSYSFPNVPTATVPYTLTATALGYLNGSTTVTTLSNGQTVTRNIQLTGTGAGNVPAPTNVLAASLTQPSSILTPNVAQARAATGSVYDTIRKIMSPKYAQWSANRQLASHSTRLKPHIGGFGAYAVEADVFFSEPANTNVSGYRIYNSTGAQSLQPYDFLQDPQASLWVDLDPSYVTNTQFNFAVSAIDTTDSIESNLSSTVSFDPLDLEVVTSPVQGQTIHNPNPVAVSWQAVNGATQYGVFIYNVYPSIGATPVASATQLTTTAFNAGPLPAGNYWALVSAADANSIDVSISQIIQFQVQ